jgi:cysteine synthase
MSKERFQIINSYGAEVIATTGSESNVKEIYDKTKELSGGDPERIRILNQFQEFGNYRFHWYVTGTSMAEFARELGVGNGRIAAVVSAVGSAGTVASGDRVKQLFPESKTIVVEPIQCPTISMNGYGSHDIQGIGDKHVTWIHNVMNTDAVIQIDDTDCKRMLQVVSDPEGIKFVDKLCGSGKGTAIADKFGISGIANVIGAIKTAKYYHMTEKDNIFAIATDNIDRYHSVMRDMDATYGKLDSREAASRTERIFHRQEPSFVFEGDVTNRTRWHNLKYFTWVEQQGKTVQELDAQRSPAFWETEQALVPETDRLIREYREKNQ